MLIENFQIGSDIEFFVQDIESGNIISAEGLVQGTKDEPFKFDPNNSGFATSLDNVLFEGNIPPVTSKTEWLQNMAILRDYINSQLPANLCSVGLPAVRMDAQWLQTKNARHFGCDPSYIIWTNSQKRTPSARTNLRTAGLHVHVSFDDGANIFTLEKLVKAQDLFLSVPAVLIEPANERKKNYGQAGEYRFGSSYLGVEYRSLSSYFAETKDRLGWVYDNTEKAIEFVNSLGESTVLDDQGEMIQDAINNNDKELASHLVNSFNIPLF